jgi:hypothetical protein
LPQNAGNLVNVGSIVTGESYYAVNDGSDQLQQQYDKLARFRQFWALIVAGFLLAAAIYVVLARSGAAAPPSGLTYMPLGDSIT